MEAVVELMTRSNLVLSIPGVDHVIGFAASHTFNLHAPEMHRSFSSGQVVAATVAGLPEEATGAPRSGPDSRCGLEMSCCGCLFFFSFFLVLFGGGSCTCLSIRSEVCMLPGGL